MATSYKTPGVFVEEIPKLPPSVAQVETAIPAFIGYTEKAEKNGESLTNKPTRISSLLEFVDYYGGDKTPAAYAVKADNNNNYAVTEVTIANTERYFMYDSLRLFYDNGGGDCYIVSVGKFGTAPIAGDEVAGTGLRGGVKTLEKADEPTIILFPDACNMIINGSDDPAFYSLQQMALAQCSKLQDRVGLFDLKENVTGGQTTAVTNFRNNIGINDLKYGAIYSPWIHTSYPREIDFSTFKGAVTPSGGGPAFNLAVITADAALNKLVTDTDAAIGEIAKVTAIVDAIKKADGTNGNLNVAAIAAPTMKDKFRELKQKVDDAAASAAARTAHQALMNFCRLSLLEFQKLKTQLLAGNLLNDVNSYATSNSLWRGAALSLIAADHNDDARVLTTLADTALVVNGLYPAIDPAWLGLATAFVAPNPNKDYGDSTLPANEPAIAKMIALDLQTAFDMIAAFADTILASSKTYQKAAQDQLYEKHPIISNIVKNIKKQLSKVPPSGAIAGVYARVDNARGVWKAPANESLSSVSGPSVQITADQQANLNVDAVAGKSINAIRTFTGRGNAIVWGARTLAGNDNEWRYISVRRFFNMVEESSKKATEPFVFEPNDANTWVKVQGMIENFLTTLWRQGALQGAKTEHAFYVAVGLGKTMTALDILEGRMIVEIGMAVVRPAEFIILRFSHKMAES
ncbi:MAG: phage tail sheath C-terminal domain-containing protein [Chitinophagaceae bacterium]